MHVCMYAFMHVCMYAGARKMPAVGRHFSSSYKCVIITIKDPFVPRY